MEPLQDALKRKHRVLTLARASQYANLSRLFPKVLQEIFGTKKAPPVEVLAFRNKTLFVRVPNPAAASELNLHSRRIIARLQAHLTDTEIARLVFRF